MLPCPRVRKPFRKAALARKRVSLYMARYIRSNEELHGSNLTEAFVKLSARNILKGTITEVKKGQTTTHVLIDIGGTVITSSITNEAADELKLAKGQSACAVIKASDVIVGID